MKKLSLFLLLLVGCTNHYRSILVDYSTDEELYVNSCTIIEQGNVVHVVHKNGVVQLYPSKSFGCKYVK